MKRRYNSSSPKLIRLFCTFFRRDFFLLSCLSLLEVKLVLDTQNNTTAGIYFIFPPGLGAAKNPLLVYISRYRTCTGMYQVPCIWRCFDLHRRSSEIVDRCDDGSVCSALFFKNLSSQQQQQCHRSTAVPVAEAGWCRRRCKSHLHLQRNHPYNATPPSALPPARPRTRPRNPRFACPSASRRSS